MKYCSLILFLIVCYTPNGAFASNWPYANGNGGPHIKADSDTVFRKASVSVGVLYGSDVQFFGRTGPITYPYMSTDVIYNLKNGLFAYASGLNVVGYNPLLAETDAGGGYYYRISKQFNGDISYTRSFFNRDAAYVIKSPSVNDINLKNTYDAGFLKSSVTLDYLFGKESDIFVTINISKHFESKFSIFDDKDYLTFDPSVIGILGTQNFVQQYAMGHNFDQYVNNIFFNNPNQPRLAGDNSMFNMLNYSLKLPIAYNRPHYTFEFAYKYSIPVNVEGFLKNHKEPFYFLTFYYVFY